MVATNEQLEDFSRGNSNERIDLHLEVYNKTNDIGYVVVEEKINQILCATPHLRKSNTEIKDFFNNEHDITRRVNYLREIFNSDYTGVIVDSQMYWYKTYDNGILFCKGKSFTDREKENLISWEELTYHYEAMILLNQLKDKNEFPTNHTSQLSFNEDNNEKTMPDLEFTQEFVDKYLIEKSSEEKYQIYELFQKKCSTDEIVNFIKNLYGIGGANYTIRGSGIGVWFDHKGIKFNRGSWNDPSLIKQLFKWNYIAKRIKTLIKEDRYLNSKEKEEYPKWLKNTENERNFIETNENTEDEKENISVEENFEYQYKVGDRVYIGLDEYEILKIGTFDIELYDFSAPLFNRTMNIIEFETKLKENPANEHLIVKNIPTTNENYYGEYNDEVDLVEHILAVYKIEQFQVAFNSNENITMWDDEREWEGKEVFDFIFDEILVYNEDDTVNLVDNNDLKKLQEYRQKYEEKEQELENLIDKKVVIDGIEYSVYDINGDIVTLKNNDIPKWKEVSLDEIKSLLLEQENTEEQEETKTDTISTNKEKSNEQEQLSLFVPREHELTDRILEEFNSLDTSYKGTFYVNSIELDKWEHIKSNKRNLTICIKSDKCTGFNETSFTQFNTDKTDEIVLRESVESNAFLKYLSQDKDFSITITPDTLMVFWHNFDEKQYDLSVGKDNILSSINDIDNTEIIDNPKQIETTVVKKTRDKVANYVLHPEIPYEERINYKITDDDLGVGKPRERFRNNINAIKVLKKLEEEDRYATLEEQEILSKYVGWGGLSKSFEKNSDWNKEYEELGNLIGFDSNEYEKAKESVNTAFYTPPIVIKAMYKALENMGLKKGNILEPSCAIGNFIGLLPNNDDLKIYGVEIDEISGKIARQLYQKSSIAIEGFENVKYPNSFFDVAIGNVPFGDFQVYDKKYDKYHFLIHDYFFAKTIDKVRPGGIIAFITAHGTLDKKSENVRKYIAQRANLLGAIRLPNNVFKGAAGTEATTDIIFLQKRDSITDMIPDWVYLDNTEDGIVMNKYYVDNPNMVLGKMEIVSTRFGPSPECLPYEDKNLEELLDNAIKNIHAEITDYKLEELEEDKSIEADLNVKNFSYTIFDDKVYYRENSRMYPQDLSVTAENRIKGLINLRDCTRELIDMQLRNYSDEKITKQQEKLNNLYDDFIKKYGLINSRANASIFNNDNSYYLLCSLEILDENGNLLRKADMFSKRTIMAHKQAKNIENANDALIASIGEKAKVDLDYMSEISHKSKEELIKDLQGIIFKIPNEDKYVTADEYLSGNIREKIKEAELANKQEPIYDINLKYLNEAKPQDLNASEISVRLGTTWIPKEYYEEFMYELFSTSRYSQSKVHINYIENTNEWRIENKGYDSYNEKARTTYGTKRINGYKIFEETLNLRDVKIYDYIKDSEGHKKQVLNGKQTAIAQGKQEQIKQAFKDWVWSDPERRNILEQKYNELFNSIKPREYDGSSIIFDGINPEITLREHQKNAIARILYGGNTLLAHEVGAGKTYEMVAAAMESKRLGLCNKSLFVVPNHIIEQFASEFLQLYPSANLLVATKKDFETANRKKFCSRIATGDYDAIIIGHSQFEKIPISVNRQIRLLEDEIDEIMNSIESSKKDGANFTTKQLMKTKKNIEIKLQRLNDTSRKDNNVVTFEQLGVDKLFVDEAHYYKNLFLYTKMSNVSGINQTEAQKSSDLFMKCKYLDVYNAKILTNEYFI